ncbi:MAG: Methionine synthase [bacterium ADurb.Bin236]|nr:MAG: Methionine synthase [bacterium ADurb.Bin236]HPN94696.1 corrinoid protein [bacterium]
MSLLEKIKDSIIEMEPELTVELTQSALAEGIAPMEIVAGGLISGIEIVGVKFKNDEVFLPEVMMSAKAFKDGFAAVSPKLKDSGYEPKGRVLIGSVKGDIHDIGKNIVIALLQGNGYEVHDAGVDAPPERFVDMVREIKPNVVGMSALLTTTMAFMRDTVSALKEAGLRDSLKIIVGGAPVSADFAKEIGADGYGEDAGEAVDLVKSLLAS